METTIILSIVALIGTILPLILKLLEAFMLRAKKEKIANIEIELTSKRMKELMLEERNRIDLLILDIKSEDKKLTMRELENKIKYTSTNNKKIIFSFGKYEKESKYF